ANLRRCPTRSLATTVATSIGHAARVVLRGETRSRGTVGRRGLGAEQELERKEREAVREVEGEGHVEGPGGEDLEFVGLLESRWKEVGVILEFELVLARWDDRSEESGGPSGRQGRGTLVLAK